MTLHIRSLSSEERYQLETLSRGNDQMAQRADLILKMASGGDVPENARLVGLHPINARKWVHRFNRSGLDGLHERRSPGRPREFNDVQRREIARIARIMSCPTLSKVRQAAIDQGVVGEISLESVRSFLHVEGVDLRK